MANGTQVNDCWPMANQTSLPSRYIGRKRRREGRLFFTLLESMYSDGTMPARVRQRWAKSKERIRESVDKLTRVQPATAQA